MTTLPTGAIVMVLFAALLHFIATQPPKKALDRHVWAIELYLEGKDKVLDADINYCKRRTTDMREQEQDKIKVYSCNINLVVKKQGEYFKRSMFVTYQKSTDDPKNLHPKMREIYKSFNLDGWRDDWH